MVRTPKPKDCRQRGVCPFYGNCKFGHDANKCRTADTDHDGQTVIEVE